MQLWGKWYALDISEQLPLSLAAPYAPPMSAHEALLADANDKLMRRRSAPKYDVHAWLRVCALACGIGSCRSAGRAMLKGSTRAGTRHALLALFRTWSCGRENGPYMVLLKRR